LHVENARGVVGPLEQSAEADEVQRVVLSMVPKVTPRMTAERSLTHSKNSLTPRARICSNSAGRVRSRWH
jgi:hypothetical protein